MTDTNNLTLCGRLTKDVGSDERDFGYLQSGACFAKLSLAVNESKKGQDGNWQDYANYFEVHLYGKIAENLKPYLTKGKQILVTGSLRQERWEKDGQKNSRVVINANNVQLLGGKSDSDNSAPTSSYAQQYQNQQNENPFKHSSGTPQFTPKSQATNQQGGFTGTTANGDYDAQDFAEDIPF